MIIDGSSGLTDLLLVTIGILLIVAGLILASVSIILLSQRAGNSRGRGGAVIVIGPFPIVLGSDKEAAQSLLLLAVIFVVTLIALFLLQIV